MIGHYQLPIHFRSVRACKAFVARATELGTIGVASPDGAEWFAPFSTIEEMRRELAASGGAIVCSACKTPVWPGTEARGFVALHENCSSAAHTGGT